MLDCLGRDVQWHLPELAGLCKDWRGPDLARACEVGGTYVDQARGGSHLHNGLIWWRYLVRIMLSRLSSSSSWLRLLGLHFPTRRTNRNPRVLTSTNRTNPTTRTNLNFSIWFVSGWPGSRVNPYPWPRERTIFRCHRSILHWISVMTIMVFYVSHKF